MYYISITKEDVVLLTTNKQRAAGHIGVTSITLYRAFKGSSCYRGKGGVVYLTDSLIKQRVRSKGVRFSSVRKP